MENWAMDGQKTVRLRGLLAELARDHPDELAAVSWLVDSEWLARQICGHAARPATTAAIFLVLRFCRTGTCGSQLRPAVPSIYGDRSPNLES